MRIVFMCCILSLVVGCRLGRSDSKPQGISDVDPNHPEADGSTSWVKPLCRAIMEKGKVTVRAVLKKHPENHCPEVVAYSIIDPELCGPTTQPEKGAVCGYVKMAPGDKGSKIKCMEIQRCTLAVPVSEKRPEGLKSGSHM